MPNRTKRSPQLEAEDNGLCNDSRLAGCIGYSVSMAGTAGFIGFLGLVHAIELAYWQGFLGRAKTCK
jgi:hypothetical protein